MRTHYNTMKPSPTLLKTPQAQDLHLRPEPEAEAETETDNEELRTETDDEQVRRVFSGFSDSHMAHSLFVASSWQVRTCSSLLCSSDFMSFCLFASCTTLPETPFNMSPFGHLLAVPADIRKVDAAYVLHDALHVFPVLNYSFRELAPIFLEERMKIIYMFQNIHTPAMTYEILTGTRFQPNA
jgi:hypothetical protein